MLEVPDVDFIMPCGVCMSGGGRMSEKAASVSVVNCLLSSLLSFIVSCCGVCLCLL